LKAKTEEVPLATEESITCLDYKETYSLDREIEQGDVYCDMLRAYECVDDELCNKVRPTATAEDLREDPATFVSPWTLLRAQA